MSKALQTAVELPLRQLRLIDTMHPGVISCPPDTPLRTVARMMATYRVHAIIVMAHGEELPDGSMWGVVSDADLVRVAQDANLDVETAGSVAATPALMVEHEVSHVVVVERHSLRPIGVVSTLDVARALAGLP